MHHPLESLRRSIFDGLILPLVGLSLMMLLILNWIGLPLINPTAPYGIISFELARNEAQASTVLASWNHPEELRAAFSLGIDFLFIPIYTSTLTLTCLWAGRFQREKRRFPSWLVLIGMPAILLAWAQMAAGLLDVAENLALVRMLLGGVSSPWPQIASLCAYTKFGLIAAGIIYSLVALLAYTGASLFTRRGVGI